MSTPESGKRPALTDEQRARIEGVVRRVCVEIVVYRIGGAR